MHLSDHFTPDPKTKTIQLMLSGGGAHGAYECGAIEVLLPFWLEKNCQIDLVTGASAGAINATLFSAALNTGHDAVRSMNSFWDKIGAKGDFYLAPLLRFHSLTNKFNIFANPDDKFPNIPRHFLSSMQWAGKSSIPIDQLKELLTDHIGKDGWEALRTGPTSTAVNAVRISRNGARTPVIFTGEQLTPQTVVASAALRDFAPYYIQGEHYEDGGYDKIAFHLREYETDILFAIGLKPLRHAHELEDHRGVKTGQLHHDLTRYYLEQDRTTHIDFLCMEHPDFWNETSAMNNTSANINRLRDMGRNDAIRWIEAHGSSFGQQSSFKPNMAVIDHIYGGKSPRLAA